MLRERSDRADRRAARPADRRSPSSTVAITWRTRRPGSGGRTRWAPMRTAGSPSPPETSLRFPAPADRRRAARPEAPLAVLVLRIRADDLPHQAVPHHVGLVEIAEGDPLHAGEDALDLNQP